MVWNIAIILRKDANTLKYDWSIISSAVKQERHGKNNIRFSPHPDWTESVVQSYNYRNSHHESYAVCYRSWINTTWASLWKRTTKLWAFNVVNHANMDKSRRRLLIDISVLFRRCGETQYVRHGFEAWKETHSAQSQKSLKAQYFDFSVNDQVEPSLCFELMDVNKMTPTNFSTAIADERTDEWKIKNIRVNFSNRHKELGNTGSSISLYSICTSQFFYMLENRPYLFFVSFL